MPKLVPIPFSAIPKDLKELILDKSGPKENFQLLKTNHYLRYKVLSNGLFGERADKVIFHFLGDSNSFTATVTKNKSSHKFDLLQQNSFSISLLQNVTTVRTLFLTNELHDTEMEGYELDRLLEVLLRKVKLVNDLHIDQVTPSWLDAICKGFRFKVTESAHFNTGTSGELNTAHNFIDFIETGLRFCKKISFDTLHEELLQALLKTRVEFIEIDVPNGIPECCPEWIMKNGLPSENENCRILISVRFYPEDEDNSEYEAFTDNPLLEIVEDMEICREMGLELSEKLEEFNLYDLTSTDYFISVHCFQKSGCVDDLRFLVAREPDTGRLEGLFEMLHFFVTRLK